MQGGFVARVCCPNQKGVLMHINNDPSDPGTVNSSRRGITLRLAMTATATVAVSLAAVAPALAGRSTLGLHNVSADHGADVHRRSNAGSVHGPYIGHLYKGDGFRVQQVDGQWCGGSAGGHVDQDGWVLCADLNSI